jgi:hypothetical protein
VSRARAASASAFSELALGCFDFSGMFDGLRTDDDAFRRVQ